VPVGESVLLRHRPWSVALDDFNIDRYLDTGAPRRYVSRVRVVQNDRPLADKKILVNDPLDVQGVRFYQASWGMTDSFRSVTLETPSSSLLDVARGQKIPLGGTNYRLTVEAVLPDFFVDEAGRADTRGFFPNNPAALVHFIDGEEAVASFWLPARSPETAFRVAAGERLFPVSSPPLRLRHIEPVLFSGIQVTYDPGVGVVGLGCLLLLSGLFLHFYPRRREFLFRFKTNGGGTRISIGAWSSRDAPELAVETQRMAEFWKGGTRDEVD
ncbi:MAG TPA: cytochrome c biogenesis protein ResB, partial [Elusimicrobiota bacterium]|nr:cytochrome c biogenesis protein ResB [Elusimicrobiota bacterium]